MSGSIGANRIPRAAVETTLKSYIEKVLRKFPGFRSAKISGSYNTSVKPDHGDIDLVIHIEGDEQDRKKLKQNFASYISSLPDDITVPFKSGRHVGKKAAGTGDIVIVQFPIEGYPDLNVQIDNMIVASEQESDYRKSFLDLPAEKQGLLVGLAKAILLEENPTEIFKRLGITDVPKLEKNQEFEFNLSNKGLTLRLVTLGDNFKELGRNEIWTSFDWSNILKLFQNYKLDGTWEDLLNDINSKLKNPRSRNRVKGVFNSLVVINAGEAGTPKGDNKLAAKTKVDNMLENMLFKGLVKELISDLLFEEITRESIALYPGKFKPPHKGHFEVAKQLLEKVDRVEILISGKEVEGITAEQSKEIWELYNTLLGGKLDVKIISESPVKYVLDTIEANPNNHYVAVYGKGEESRYRNVGKDPRYMNAEIFDGGTTMSGGESINATDFRNALKSGEDISKYIPSGIDKQEASSILGMDSVNEMSQSSLQSVEDFADKELDPLDIEFSSHFFDRLNDPRNLIPITSDELIEFFKRLSYKKGQLISFLKKYKEIVATDNKTNINIPLVQQANSVIAKTIMRKKNFQSSNPKVQFNEQCGCDSPLPTTLKDAMLSLTTYMIENDMNILPLPSLKIIDNDSNNANNIFGKTAYYNPNECSITLFTLNRHPKDILRSYSHEMIHRIQDNEGRLKNVSTTNTNEDDELLELEKEAYLNGNITFRNWEDSLKNPKPVNEMYFLNTEKYNRPRTIHENLWHTLNEITLTPDNAVETYGNLDKGKFQVGNTTYTYDIKQVSNPYNDGGRFFNIMFHPEENVTSTPQEGKENYIKILSTMYKVILDFAEEAEPEYIGIASMDNNNSKNYHMVYANLTDNKSNRIPGYSRKDVSLPFDTPQGKGRFVVLKRTDV